MKILKLILAPILIFQGSQVRKNTPRLPEAKGMRKGSQGNGDRQIRLLILGDSAAAGVGIDSQSQALSGQILSCFGGAYRVEWELIAKTGTTTAQTLDHLDSLAPVVFDVAVTSLGVNDVKAGVDRDKWLAQQKQLVLVLQKKFKVQQILLSAVPPMDLFPALPWPLNWYLGFCSRQLNRALKDWLIDQAHCEFIEFNMPMDPTLMAEDGFHPGPKLHTIWGKDIFDRITRRPFNHLRPPLV